MATKGKDPGKARKVQADQAKHSQEYAKHEADFEDKTAKAHVKASNAKVAVAAKSTSKVKEILARAVEDKKSTAELVKIALDGISKIATIEKNEAKEVSELNKRLTAAKIQRNKDDTETNRKMVKALEEEFASVMDYYEQKSGDIFDKFKAIQNQHLLDNSKIGKQIAATVLKDRVEQAKAREKDFLESRRETMRQLALKLDVAKTTGNEELQKLLKQQAKEAKASNIAVFDELQKEIERRLDDSDTATQKAFQHAEKLAAKQGYFSSKIDSAKDSLNISRGAKNLVGKIGIGGYTIGSWQANKRAKEQVSIEDMFAKKRKDEEDAKKRQEESDNGKDDSPDAANPFAFHKQSAKSGSDDGAEAELQKMAEREQADEEVEELKGINKSLAKVAKGSKDDGGGPIGGMLTALTAGLGALTAGLGKMLFKGTGKAAEKAVEKAGEKAVEKAGEKAVGKVGEKAIQKSGEKAAEQAGSKGVEKTAEKIGEKSVAKLGEKALGKSLLKKIPGIGLGMGAYFAAERISDGDYLGAAGEAASGVASLIPGYGTAVSIAIDAGLAGRDIYNADGSAKEDTDKKSSGRTASGKVSTPPKPTAPPAPKPLPSTGAGGGRGNAQAQMASIAANSGQDGKEASISGGGPASANLQALVTTTGNVDLGDLTPQAQQNLTNLARDYNQNTGKKLKINSAYRSRAKQEQLYADYKAGKPGANPANPPGSSLHEVGLAVDIQPSQVDEADKMGLLVRNGFERISGPRERQHIQLAGAQAAISSGTSFVSGDALGAGKSSTLGAGESFVDAPTRSAPSNTANDKITVASSDDSSSSSSVQGPSYQGAGGGRGSGGSGAPNKGSPISVTSVPTFMFVDPAFYATNVQAMA